MFSIRIFRTIPEHLERWPQFGSDHNGSPSKPFLGSPRHALEQGADDRCGARIGLSGALGVDPEKHCWIMTAARGQDMNRYSRVKQKRLMSRTQIMKA